MEVTNHSLIEFKAESTVETHAWHLKSSQEPLVEKPTESTHELELISGLLRILNAMHLDSYDMALHVLPQQAQ